MDIALRFSYNGTNTDFYVEEVPKINIDNKQYMILHRNLFNEAINSTSFNGYTHAELYRKYLWGKAYRIFSVNFLIKYKTTRAKIKTLYDYVEATHGNPQIIQMYNEYKIDTDLGNTPSWVPAQMIRQDYKDRYYTGYDVYDTLSVRFVETTYSGVGVLETPQLITNRIPIS